MKFLLLDMDDVLLKPGAYHRALKQTVRLVAAALGYGRVSLSQEDILAFESAGVYSEWDASAICAALLLVAAWQVDPAIQLPTTVADKRSSHLGIRPPDFSFFASQLKHPGLEGMRPLGRAEWLLLENANSFTPEQSAQLRAILHTARAADGSLTHCTFQELVLGSQVYAQTYRRPPVLDSQSYLQRYDVPLVTPVTVTRILRWLENPAHKAAIFTGRPSKPLPGVFSTPEAELGAELVGLENVPIIGLGNLLWLSQQRHAGPQAFVKPSPVHVLSALLLALAHPPQACLQEAAALALDSQPNPIWKDLEGAQIAVFDDSPAGLGSAVSARACLVGAGLSIEMDLYGIARNPQKVTALRRLEAQTHPDLTAALDSMHFDADA